MPTLETPDGKQVDVTPPDPDKTNSDFSRAMNDDGPDKQAPPQRRRRVAAASEDAEPAPARRRGRPPKEEQARTAEAPVKDDYADDAQNLVGTVWTVTAMIPPAQAYALVIENNSDALVSALAEGAKHNSTIRSWVSTGESSWMLQLAGVSLSMGVQAYALMRDPAMREQAAASTRASLKAAIGEKNIEIKEPETAHAA